MQSLWLVGRNVVTMNNTYCLHLFLHPPSLCFFFFFLLLMTDDSAPVVLFSPFGSGYSSYVSTCFAGSCQLTLVCIYETYFAIQFKWV